MLHTQFEVNQMIAVGGVRSNAMPGKCQKMAAKWKMADFLLGLGNGSKRLFCSFRCGPHMWWISSAYVKPRHWKMSKQGHFVLPVGGAMFVNEDWHVTVFRSGPWSILSSFMWLWHFIVELQRCVVHGKALDLRGHVGHAPSVRVNISTDPASSRCLVFFKQYLKQLCIFK